MPEVIVSGHIRTSAICIPDYVPPSNKPRRLLNINLFFQVTMQESIFDI
ncbi:hypothetical protein MtrunA17_Chr4g0030091 [Medicago truncatula]|uniref:Uncharacterized protein n=1 Tax=Medicago truncatula TaxID=3880 RepID=A0A396I5G1_MEDTR|nr:hypothetical protein MtrunA17_Chr4g0030091 [Medicago truncatula]